MCSMKYLPIFGKQIVRSNQQEQDSFDNYKDTAEKESFFSKSWEATIESSFYLRQMPEKTFLRHTNIFLMIFCLNREQRRGCGCS